MSDNPELLIYSAPHCCSLTPITTFWPKAASSGRWLPRSPPQLGLHDNLKAVMAAVRAASVQIVVSSRITDGSRMTSMAGIIRVPIWRAAMHSRFLPMAAGAVNGIPTSHRNSGDLICHRALEQQWLCQHQPRYPVEAKIDHTRHSGRSDCQHLSGKHRQICRRTGLSCDAWFEMRQRQPATKLCAAPMTSTARPMPTRSLPPPNWWQHFRPPSSRCLKEYDDDRSS